MTTQTHHIVCSILCVVAFALTGCSKNTPQAPPKDQVQDALRASLPPFLSLNAVDADVGIKVVVVVVEVVDVNVGIKVVVVDLVMGVVADVFVDFDEHPDIAAIKMAISPTTRQ